MSALLDALRHPANRPGALVRRLAGMVNPSADLRGLEDGGGVFCDFAPGHEEKDPSLSAGMGHGGPVFKRHGKDFGGGAVGFVSYCLNVTKGEAARLLVEWAGIVDTAPGEGKKAPTKRQEAGAVKLMGKLGKLKPLEDAKAASDLRGWVKVEAGEETPEALEVARRGLSPALPSGLLNVRRFVGRYGGTPGGPQKTRTLPRHILPGALAFEVRGPDGQPWAVKVRNPGSKEDLEAAGAQRYAYLTAGQSTPAWCSPGASAAPAHVIVEGELNGVAVALMLEAAGYGGAFGVQGVASAEALPHVSPVKEGAEVYLYADPDEAGEKARKTWGGLLAHLGAKVYQIGQGGSLWPGGVLADACDALGTVGEGHTPETWTAYLGERLTKALTEAPQWLPPSPEEGGGEGQAGDVWETKRKGYGLRGGRLCALTVRKDEDSGKEYESAEVLADFAAFITAEVIEEDGSGEARRVFHIEGHRPDGAPLFPPVVTVPTSDFSGMSWPVARWGGEARLPAGQGKKDKARDAIQTLSNARGYPRRTVYQHTGWITHPEHGPVYLTAGAVIGAAGGVDGVAVELTGRLSAYALPDPAKGEDGTPRPLEEVQEAVRASLALLDLAPDAVAVPLLGAAYRAALGPADFVLWTVGETGRHKTAFMGLIQAHYGARWGRKFLPDGWNSSANALESNAFRVKDALFVIDDFKPSGSAGDRARLEGTASRIIQGAADGAGRGTLTADRKTRAALYPRGLIAASAEDLPRVHSNRARLVMVEVGRRLIDSPAKSAAYFSGEEKAGAGVYALALAGLVQAVASSYDGVRVGSPAHLARVRQLAPHFQGAHARNGDAAAELAYGWEVFLSFAVQVGALGEGEAWGLWERVTAALSETAHSQGEHLTEADPVARALGLLSGLLAQGRVYLEDLRGGGAPDGDAAALCGWQRHVFRTGDGEEETWRTRPGAVMLGYYSKSGGDEWGHFLPDGLHEALQRAVQGQAGALLPDGSKLWANMRDRLHPLGAMKCDAEAGRLRATARATLPDGSRQKLITLRFPLGASYQTVGPVGPLGPDGEERTSDTASSAGPTFNLYLFQVGPVGPIEEGEPLMA